MYSSIVHCIWYARKLQDFPPLLQWTRTTRKVPTMIRMLACTGLLAQPDVQTIFSNQYYYLTTVVEKEIN